MVAIPLMIDLKDRNVTVIGGGKIAERRVKTLLEGEALITIVSPDLTDELTSLNQNHLIQWKRKKFSARDVENSDFIVVATNDPIVNKEVIKSAPPHAYINSVESASDGNVRFPTHLKRGKLSIAISTNGASPMLAISIKKQLEKLYDESYEYYVDFLYEVRKIVKQSSLSLEERKAILRQALEDEFFDRKKQDEFINWMKNKTH